MKRAVDIVIFLAIVGAAVLIMQAWGHVVKWADPAPHNLQMWKLPGLILGLLFILGATWVDEKFRKNRTKT